MSYINGFAVQYIWSSPPFTPCSPVKPPLIEFLNQPAEGDMMKHNWQLFLCHCGGTVIGGQHESITVSLSWLYNMELLSQCVWWAVDVCQIAVTEDSEQERHDCFKPTSCVWSFSSKQMTKKGLDMFFVKSHLSILACQRVFACIS